MNLKNKKFYKIKQIKLTENLSRYKVDEKE